jgi:Icc protein
MTSQISQYSPAFILHCGDIACGGHGFDASPAVFAESMAEAKRLESGFSSPCIYVAGNHDVDPESGSKSIFFELFAARHNGYHSFSRGKIRFILLDTQDLEEDKTYGYIGDLQLGWLDRELYESTRKGEIALLFSHHPLLPAPGGIGEGYVLSNSEDALEVIDGHSNVRAAFSGHLHINRIWERKQVTHICTSAIDSYPCSWRLLHVGQHTLNVETYHLVLDDDLRRMAEMNLDHSLKKLQRGIERDLKFSINLI